MHKSKNNSTEKQPDNFPAAWLRWLLIILATIALLVAKLRSGPPRNDFPSGVR